MSSCVGTRYLQEDETILYNQRIEGADAVDPGRLDNLYRMEPNKRFPLIPWAPYVGIYQAGIRRYDRQALREARDNRRHYWDSLALQHAEAPKVLSRIQRKRTQELNRLDKAITEGNLLMRWGEPLAVYNENEISYTTNQIQQYLFNRGYFEGEVSFSTTTKNKRTSVTYHVTEGRPYVLDSVALVTRDDSIAALLETFSAESLIRVGDNYDAEVLEDERNRIDDFLKDHGYYSFSRNYITYEVDTTTLGSRHIILRTLIRTPPGKTRHRIYHIDSVIVFTDANVTGAGVRQREKVNDLVYRYFLREYAPNILEDRIFLTPGDLYSRSNTLATQRQLANLDNFKFINVKYDTLGGAFTARVYMSPLPKRQISDEIGLVVSQGVPGPLLNVTFTNRNVFRHLENLQTSGRFSIEGVYDELADSKFGTSTEASANLSLVFPQFLLPVKKAVRREWGYRNPRTRTQLGYAFNRRPQYTRSTVNGSFIYNWETLRGTRYSYELLDVALINSSRIRDDFQEVLDAADAQGNALKRTFDPSFVIGSNVSVTYNILDKEASQQEAAYLRVLADVGGTLWNLIDPTKVVGDSLETFQYVKLNTDFIRYRPLGQYGVLAYRINVGAAYAYGPNGALPYEKYFFAGGSTSLRAWRPRRLGPGSFGQRDAMNNIQYQFDQQGEILLAGSVEWRRNIFDFIDGALFVDVGNTWTFREDATRPGSQFAMDRFWNEFAIGVGAGIRADFSFLILRIDLGMKAYDPAFEMGERWFPSQYNYRQVFNTQDEAFIINLGIGYPF